MIALGIRYLCGVSVAADPATRGPEWPPHSGRIFMAMAAAHFETGEDSEERAALEWLEKLSSAPSIWASDAYDRTAVECYVPANDVDYALVRRTRQTRTFQKTRPVIDSVFLIW